MKSFIISLINLLWLYLIVFEDQTGCCLDTVWQLPRPSISHLQADNSKKRLTVNWRVNLSGFVVDINEIQISRTENHSVIFNKNISTSSADSHNYTWTWSSDLPLECVDHSVRIRYFYNQSFSSPWSKWITNYGVKVKNKTKMFPFQQVLREGNSAMFCCVPPPGVNITNITFNKKPYPLISIGARVKAIAIDNVTMPQTLNRAQLLNCDDTTGQSNSVWNYVSFPSEKPRNLSCGTSDLTVVTCTWDPGRRRDPYDGNKQNNTLYIENSDHISVTCEASSCTFPAVPQLEIYNIRVVVKDQLGEEMERHSFSISDRVFPAVEWDRVKPGMTDITVSWTVPQTLNQVTLICQVSVDPHGTTELTCKSVSRLCKVKVEHLLPDTRYSTRVRCSVSGTLWGEWTQTVPFRTYPFVTLNLWRRIKSNPHSRQVTLLWNLDVTGSATTVTVQGYTVQWSEEGQNKSMWRDSEQTEAEIHIGPGRYDFTVLAELHTGLSVPAHIIIPKLNDRENLLVNKQLISNRGGGFNLSWAQQDTATCGYTVEWCILGNIVPCTLQWINMLKGNNTLFLPAKNFQAGCWYTFNIYGCTETGPTLLEIQTGYSQELQAVHTLSLTERVHSASSSVILKWCYSDDNPSLLALVTGYLVTVQEIGSNMLSSHAANSFNVSVTDPQRKSVTIEGLKHSQEYTFSVSVLTKNGPGPPTVITTRTRSSLASVHLAKILTPVLLLLGCTMILWPRRNMLKRRLKEIFYPAGMNIKMFELDSFLYEINERMLSHKLEECISCDIEILNTHPPLNETITQRESEPLNTPPSPGSQSSASSSSAPGVMVQGYQPKSSMQLYEEPSFQQTCIMNKNYYLSTGEDFSEPQDDTLNETKSNYKLSDCEQESCIFINDYIPISAQ